MPVEVLQPDPGALESLRSLIAPLISPLATTGIIVIFVIFILIQREDLRNRLIRLAGSHDLQRTTAALDDAGSRLSRLFLNQLLINTGFGILIGTGLWADRHSECRALGYSGGRPAVRSLYRFDHRRGVPARARGCSRSRLVDAGLDRRVVLRRRAGIGQIVEPMIYGRSTGLSPVAVVVSATFWTALWGPIGLVLATPLTVCLVVLGRHVERLAFLDVMFGDRPALSPPEIFYQRMLAGDPTEATEKAEEFLKERSLSSYYDEVAIKGLQLAQSDLERDVLDQSRLGKVRDTVIEFVNDLSDQTDQEPTGERDDRRRGSGRRGRGCANRSTPIYRSCSGTSSRSNGKATTPSCALPAGPRSTKPPGSCSPNSATSTGCGRAWKGRKRCRPAIFFDWRATVSCWFACPTSLRVKSGTNSLCGAAPARKTAACDHHDRMLGRRRDGGG